MKKEKAATTASITEALVDELEEKLVEAQNTNALVYNIANRAKQLANMKMPLLKKLAEADVTAKTRGELVEWVLVQEFVKDDF